MKQLILFLLIAGGLFVVAKKRAKQPEYIKISGYTQGTTYNITYENNDVGDLSQEIDKLLKEFDLSLSAYIPNSIISSVNANANDVLADVYFEEVFRASQDVYEKSGGYFDITVGPIVNAYGFGPGKKLEIQTQTIDSLMQYVGMEKVKFVDGKVVKTYPQIQLDVNAIAQGYSVDVIARYLENKGIDDYLVEIGGELKAKGKNPKGEIWKVGIDKPVEGNYTAGSSLQAVVALKNKSLATSGNYRKFYEAGGVKYAHSINPKTGEAVSHRLLSVTIFHESCMYADAYATACMAMGLEKAIEFVKKEKIDVYFIYNDKQGNYQVYESPDVKKMIIR